MRAVAWAILPVPSAPLTGRIARATFRAGALPLFVFLRLRKSGGMLGAETPSLENNAPDLFPDDLGALGRDTRSGDGSCHTARDHGEGGGGLQ